MDTESTAEMRPVVVVLPRAPGARFTVFARPMVHDGEPGAFIMFAWTPAHGPALPVCGAFLAPAPRDSVELVQAALDVVRMAAPLQGSAAQALRFLRNVGAMPPADANAEGGAGL